MYISEEFRIDDIQKKGGTVLALVSENMVYTLCPVRRGALYGVSALPLSYFNIHYGRGSYITMFSVYVYVDLLTKCQDEKQPIYYSYCKMGRVWLLFIILYTYIVLFYLVYLCTICVVFLSVFLNVYGSDSPIQGLVLYTYFVLSAVPIPDLIKVQIFDDCR